MLQFEYLCNLAVDVGEIVTMGPGPLGERRIIAILGGTFEGPQMRGTVPDGGYRSVRTSSSHRRASAASGGFLDR